jgi:hypothetical protein
MSAMSDAVAQQIIAKMARERGLPEWMLEMVLAEPAGFMQGVIGDRSKPIHQPSSLFVAKPKPTPSRPSEADMARREASERADAERRAADVARYEADLQRRARL